jgi:hypothetical protein
MRGLLWTGAGTPPPHNLGRHISGDRGAGLLGPVGPGHSCRASYQCDRPPARRAHPRGPGSSPFQRVEHAAQRLPIEAAADADTVLAGNIDLDLLGASR